MAVESHGLTLTVFLGVWVLNMRPISPAPAKEGFYAHV